MKRIIAYEIAMGQVPEGWQRATDRLGWKNGRRFVSDLEVSKEAFDHTCAICGDGPDPDIRTLRMSAFYDLTEVSEKFTQGKDGSYSLKFCKPCRGHFLFDIVAPWAASKGHKVHPNWNGEAPVQYA